MDDHPARMDRIYHYQRHLYDATRRFFLPSRQELIRQIGAWMPAGARVLEVGCGTAWNLTRLAERRPDLELYGIDASREMLRTAERCIFQAGLQGRVKVAYALAECLDKHPFTPPGRAFDCVFFSYSLSMIPSWKEAILQAHSALNTGGLLALVDFGDMTGLPWLCREALQKWMSLFGVRDRSEAIRTLEALGLQLHQKRYLGGYAFIALAARELRTHLHKEC